MYSKAALQESFNLEDDFLSQAEFSLHEAIDNSNIDQSLAIAIDQYRKAHKDAEAELCLDIRKVLKQQRTLSEK